MKLFKVIDEKEGKNLLKEKRVYSSENNIVLGLLIEEKLDTDYVKNIINFLESYRNYCLDGIVISVFNENKEKENEILDEGIIEILKNIEQSIIIVLNTEKERLKAKENLERAVKRISNLPNIEILLSNKVSFYNFASARGEEKCEKVVDNLLLSLPKKYIDISEYCLLRIEQPFNMEIQQTSIIIDKISEKLRQKEDSLEVDIEMNKNVKDRVDVDIIFNFFYDRQQIDNLKLDDLDLPVWMRKK